VAIAVAMMGPMTARALADGDPASDVLATQSLFLPWDAGVPGDQQAQLAALLAASTHAGYQIRVALIASPSDLGSVTALWRQPQNYAEFLGEELSLVYHGPLLVIMPDGFGLYKYGHAATSPGTALAGVRIRTSGAGLASAAVAAVRHLAAAAGHHLTVARASATLRAAPAQTASWVVFAVGWVLIALAWTASLRARPLRARSLRASRRGA
jgi:hypothetical protein